MIKIHKTPIPTEIIKTQASREIINLLKKTTNLKNKNKLYGMIEEHPNIIEHLRNLTTQNTTKSNNWRYVPSKTQYMKEMDTLVKFQNTINRLARKNLNDYNSTKILQGTTQGRSPMSL